MTVRSAVLVYNFQNEIVHPDGRIATRGNAASVARRGVLGRLAGLLRTARLSEVALIYIGNGYDSDYTGLNRSVPLFADHEATGRLHVGSWEAAFHADVAPEEGDVVLFRAGIGAFANGALADHLPTAEGTRLYVAGVSTRLVVEAAAFELTDRGYAVSVIEDCCAAATEDQHLEGIRVLSAFTEVISAEQVAARLSVEI